jgi:membrane protease YdiL (CAAX protease family)
LARKRHGRRGGGAAAAGGGTGDDGGAAANGLRELGAGWATLLIGLLVTGFLFWANNYSDLTAGFERYYLLNTALLLWVPLVTILVLLRRSPEDFAFGTGDLRGGLLAAGLLFALFVPVILWKAPSEAFQEYYVRQLRYSGAIVGFGRDWNVGRFVYHQVVLGFYMFAWEWYFRGFLLFGLKRLMPVPWAALLQAVAFALLHYNKPLDEVVSSFFGALLLAVVALRYRSFLPCFFLHWAISAAFDGAVLYHFLHPGAGGGLFQINRPG